MFHWSKFCQQDISYAIEIRKKIDWLAANSTTSHVPGRPSTFNSPRTPLMDQEESGRPSTSNSPRTPRMDQEESSVKASSATQPERK